MRRTREGALAHADPHFASHSHPNRRALFIATPTPETRDWAPVIRDYAATELLVRELCALHRVSRSAFYDYIKRMDIPRRVPEAGRRNARPMREAELAQRLLTALDEQMTQLESRRSADPANTAADSDRDARTLTSLLRLFDKPKSLGEKAAPKKAAAAAVSAQGKVAHDADRLRYALAERLEKLRVGLEG